MESSFNDEELHSLCFNLSVNYDNLPGDTLSRRIQELVGQLNRRHRITALISAIENERPHIEWATLIPAFDDKDAASPFKGLENFTEDDSHLFFGRDVWITNIVNRLSTTKFLAVVGASGSGKSSLVQAGVTPILKGNRRWPHDCQPPTGSQDWLHCLIRPDVHPIKELATALAQGSDSVRAITTLMDDMTQDSRSLDLYVSRLLKEKGKEQSVLVIDQFEELFTLCNDEGERSAFIDNLIVATAPETAGRTRLILTLRADFYHYCANYPLLRDAVAENQIYIGAMEPADLRAAIEEPAEREGYEFEAGLVDLILRDVGGEPGGLPLISHALLVTWTRREGKQLTLAGYMSAGGVRGAIAKTAESTFQHLSYEQQIISRNMFLRLTEYGEDIQYTRRRATFNELVPDSLSERKVMEVIQILSQARLITTARESLEIAHEALIREWPRLLQWLEENRDDLRLHRKLADAANIWFSLDKDEAALYRGRLLADAQDWASRHEKNLNALEREFLEVSQFTLDAEKRMREDALQRELTLKENLLEQERELNAGREWELTQARALADSEKQRVLEQQEMSNKLQSQIRVRNTLIAFLLILIVCLLTLTFYSKFVS